MHTTGIPQENCERDGDQTREIHQEKGRERKGSGRKEMEEEDMTRKDGATKDVWRCDI